MSGVETGGQTRPSGLKIRLPGTAISEAETGAKNRPWRPRMCTETGKGQNEIGEIARKSGLILINGRLRGLQGLGGGRTRARTWDPMIKSLMLTQIFQ